jgi:predicted trehalose synthase
MMPTVNVTGGWEAITEGPAREELERVVLLWFQWVSAAFLRDYRAAARGQPFVPDDTAAFAELLDAFMLEKIFYELHYELNNRPDWVRIPLRGILTLLEKMPSLECRVRA